MTRNAPAKNSAIAGEVSRFIEARDDIPQYAASMRQLHNCVIHVQGAVSRRPGTKFVKEVKTSANFTRLIPFTFSIEQAYICEFGDQYIRFFANNGRVESPPNTPVEITSPYLSADLPLLRFTQSADTMWIVHPNYHPYKLTRTSLTTFTLTKVVFDINNKAPFQKNLPFLNSSNQQINTYQYDITYSPLVRPLHASNRSYEFTSADIGSWFRWGYFNGAATAYSYAVIQSLATTHFTNDSFVPVTPLIQNGATTNVANRDVAVGSFADTRGASAVIFHEGRLWYGGGKAEPNRLHGSASDAFEDFEIGANADDPISKRILSNTVDSIKWLQSVAGQLVVGTSSGEYRLKAANEEVITPSNAPLVPASKRGSAAVPALTIDDEAIFVQRNNRTLRKFNFSFESNSFSSENLSILSSQFLQDGITDMVYQQDPMSIIWVVLGDGHLGGFTYEKEQQVLAAHHHGMGGTFVDTGYGIIESLAVIPSPDGTSDQLWMIVKRTINGATKRFVEYMVPLFAPITGHKPTSLELIQQRDSAFFVDSGLSTDTPKTITAISIGASTTITSTAHGFVNGDTIRIRDVKGTIKDIINNKTFIVAAAAANTFEIQATAAVNFPSTGYTYTSGGNARKEFTVFSGLTHLEGQSVQVWADGAYSGAYTVSGGNITISPKASLVHAGLGYTSFAETQRFNEGAKAGTAQGKKQRLQAATLRLLDTTALSVGVGPSGTDLESIKFDTVVAGMPSPLFSGDKKVILQGGWEKDPTIYFEANTPAPFTVVGVFPVSETRDA